MRLFDTHVHADRFHRGGEWDGVVARAREAGVERMALMGGREESNALALSLAAAAPECLRCAVGFDRDEAQRAPDLAALREQAVHPSVVALGELGLDYHYAAETASAQRRLVEGQLALAAALALPVAFHSRDADEDTLGLLGDFVAAWPGEPDRPGVLHCFTRDRAMARSLLDLGFLLSFSGIVTFRNAEALREVAAFVPLDRMLVETDTPYLAPEPVRGQTNEPAFVGHVARELARVRGMDAEALAEITTRNACRLFAWGAAPTRTPS